MFDQKERFAPWKRFLLGSLVMFVAAGAVTMITAFSQIKSLATEIQERELPGVSRWLDHDPGGPQTIMLLGSDGRSGDKKLGLPPRSDTIMLVRLDPDSDVTTVMSLPRDLKVEIPGYGTDKINAAYALGKASLTLRTVKNLTGIKINRVVNVDFKGFRQAVDRLGCVYMDIDRRYFNDNTNAPYGDYFATIDLQPGYQKVCGQDALDYVRYRHGDNDIVRGARQQDFLRQARNQAGLRELITNAKALKRIVIRNTKISHIDSRGLQRLLTLAVRSAGKPIQEVRIATAFDDPYVVATPGAVERAARKFERPVIAAAEPGAGPPGDGDGDGDGATGATGRPRDQSGRRPAKRKRRRPARAVPGVIEAVAEGKIQGALLARRARMPVFFPRMRSQGTVYSPEPRAYRIRIPDGSLKRAYRIVARTNETGEYYGVQGSRWTNPPALESPSETRTYRGRRFELFYDGSKLGLVAWRRPGSVYWVTNTLSRVLTERQMLAIAASLTRYRG